MSLIMAMLPPAAACHSIPFSPSARVAPDQAAWRLFLDIAVGVELTDVGPQIVDPLLVFDAGEGHFGTRNHGARALDVLLESRLVPDDARILIGVRIVEIRHGAGMPAVEPVQLGADLVRRVRPDRVAGRAHIENLLALVGVLGPGRAHRDLHADCARHCGDHCRRRPCSSHCVSSFGIIAVKPPSVVQASPVRRVNCRERHGFRRIRNQIDTRMAGAFSAIMRGKSLAEVPMPLLMPLFDDAVLKRRAEIVAALRRIVPGEGVIASEEGMRPFESDGLTAYRQLPMVVALPETTAQVSAVLGYCHGEGIKVVPRGAGTSLSGGALPLGDGVLLGLAKFNRIREIDYDNRVAVVEPGVTNLAVSGAVQEAGFYYAPDPSSQIACTIGGNVAENSGGVHCLKYGV